MSKREFQIFQLRFLQIQICYSHFAQNTLLYGICKWISTVVIVQTQGCYCATLFHFLTNKSPTPLIRTLNEVWLTSYTLVNEEKVRSRELWGIYPAHSIPCTVEMVRRKFNCRVWPLDHPLLGTFFLLERWFEAWQNVGPEIRSCMTQPFSWLSSSSSFDSVLPSHRWAPASVVFQFLIPHWRRHQEMNRGDSSVSWGGLESGLTDQKLEPAAHSCSTREHVSPFGGKPPEIPVLTFFFFFNIYVSAKQS